MSKIEELVVRGAIGMRSEVVAVSVTPGVRNQLRAIARRWGWSLSYTAWVAILVGLTALERGKRWGELSGSGVDVGNNGDVQLPLI